MQLTLRRGLDKVARALRQPRRVPLAFRAQPVHYVPELTQFGLVAANTHEIEEACSDLVEESHDVAMPEQRRLAVRRRAGQVAEHA